MKVPAKMLKNSFFRCIVSFVIQITIWEVMEIFPVYIFYLNYYNELNMKLLKMEFLKNSKINKTN